MTSGNQAPVSKQSRMRRFVLERVEDVSGVSGTGIIAEGVMWSDGTVALSWLSHVHTRGQYPNIDAVKYLHGHGGRTKVVFIDEEPTP